MSESPAPKPKRGALRTILIVAGIVLGGLIVIGFIVGPQKGKTKEAVVENSEWDGSVRQVERYLKATLKDPGSYEAVDWSPVATLPAPLGDGSFYVVRHKFRAKNSFGGYVVENKQFWIDKKGAVVNVTDWK
jgi:hypothetical protein